MDTNLRAATTISLVFLDCNAAAQTNSPPTPSAAAPAWVNSEAVVAFAPPVGTMGMGGRGAFSALMYFAPPTVPQGKTFTRSLPAFQAVMTSVGVRAPAITSLPARTAIPQCGRDRSIPVQGGRQSHAR